MRAVTRLRSWFLRTDVQTSIVAAVLATVIAVLTLGMIGMRWDVPLTYSGDGLAVAAHFKTILSTGWYEYQPALGAPYGQVYHDYPTADNLHFVAAWLLGLVFHNWGVIMNVHFLVGFPLAALAAVWFLRRVGVSAVLTVVIAVLYAIAPYHFSRSEGHLFLSWYWVVPLVLVIVYDVLVGAPIWGARAGVRRGLGHILGRSGGTAAVLVLTASAAAYYAVFALILGGIAALAALWLTRNWRRFAGAAVAAGVLVVTLVANMTPDLLYRLTNGADPGALQRTPVESEIYALKLTQLLLPASWHRFGPFRFLREQYDAHYPLPSEGPALGLIAAAGLIALVIAAFYVIARTVLTPKAEHGDLANRLMPLAFLALLAFLFSTVGGLSTLISFVSTALRSWNRMSIVIAMLALAAVGILLDVAIRWLVARRNLAAVPARIAVVALGIVVLLVGTWDQTPPIDTSARAATVASFDSDAAFSADLETALDTGAMVFELPYIDFPESPPVGRTLDSDQFRVFLHSTTLRFSGGGIRGRDTIDGLGDLADLTPAEFVAGATELGFVGVVLDTFGYSSQQELDSLRDVATGAEIDSPDGRFVYLGFAD